MPTNITTIYLAAPDSMVLSWFLTVQAKDFGRIEFLAQPVKAGIIIRKLSVEVLNRVAFHFALLTF